MKKIAVPNFSPLGNKHMQRWSKWQQSAWWLLGFLLPWQTVYLIREVFLEGAKWEWGTVGIYATEILAWGLVLSFLWHKRKHLQVGVTKLSVPILISILAGVVVMQQGSDVSLATQTVSRLVLAISVAGILYINDNYWQSIVKGLWWSVVPVCCLTVWQFVMQGSPAFSWLGLSFIDPTILGTAIIDTEVGRVLRAYGPFSHPNILGGYALSVLILTFFSNIPSPFRFKQLVVILAMITVVLSFSRSALLGTIILFVVLLIKKIYVTRPRLLGSFVITGVIGALVFSPLLLPRVVANTRVEEQSMSERITQYRAARVIMQQHWLLGTGPGQYGYALQQQFPGQPGWYYQPVHNVFLLFLAEFGVIAICIGGIFLWVGKTQWRGAIVLAPLLPIFLLDHYLYTVFSMNIMMGIIVVQALRLPGSTTTTS